MTNGIFVASTISVNGMIPNSGMVVVPRSWRRSIIVVDGIHREGGVQGREQPHDPRGVGGPRQAQKEGGGGGGGGKGDGPQDMEDH